MKYMTINNRKVAFDEEKNVLVVIRKSGIDLPTLSLSFRVVDVWGLPDVCGRR